MKKLNYFLLKLIYPKPSKIIKPKKNEASTVKIQKSYYKLYCINKARLYTDTIHTFAVIDKDNNLIDGPSYQIINNNFVICIINQLDFKLVYKTIVVTLNCQQNSVSVPRNDVLVPWDLFSTKYVVYKFAKRY